MSNVDYKTLAMGISRACRCEKGQINFIVNPERLEPTITDMDLKLLNVGFTSKKVTPDIVPFLQEYFKTNSLSWMTEYRDYTVLVMVPNESIDEECQKYINELEIDQVDDPDIDKVHALACITASYPCYFATVVSYMSNDPNRLNRASFEVRCRANTVKLKSDGYNYNAKDI